MTDRFTRRSVADPVTDDLELLFLGRWRSAGSAGASCSRPPRSSARRRARADPRGLRRLGHTAAVGGAAVRRAIDRRRAVRGRQRAGQRRADARPLARGRAERLQLGRLHRRGHGRRSSARRTGIKVHYDKFPTPPRRCSRRSGATGRARGFDVCYPTSVDVPALVSEGVVQP